MSRYAGQALFDSGPHSFRVGAFPRHLARRDFAGLDGQLIVDLGRRGRAIVQTGRLQADTAAQLAGLCRAIADAADGAAHELVDTLGNTFPRTLLVRFEPATPALAGRGCYCDYSVEYLQLP